MPVLGSGDDDAVNVLIVERSPHVEHALGTAAGDRFEMIDGLAAVCVVDLADVFEVDVLDALEFLRQVIAASAGAD